MTWTIAGHMVQLDALGVEQRAAGHIPEAIHQHWVEVGGMRWPPKQVLELATGISRSEFISHTALRILRDLGFSTSDWRTTASQPERTPPTPAISASGPDVASADDLRQELLAAVGVLADFLGSQGLTQRLAALEQALVGTSLATVVTTVEAAEVSTDTLAAALTVRSTLGRLSDVVHAAVICIALPLILERDEVVTNRPSLAAGNDPSRLFDLETNMRFAEFKVSVWRGADAMRKRGVFADLVHLALQSDPRRRQLFVVGRQPIHFLETSKSPAKWGLSRGSDRLREQFIGRYGSLDIPISTFRSEHASNVDIVDLNDLIPGLEAMIAV
jgi:hypothetical protein